MDASGASVDAPSADGQSIRWCSPPTQDLETALSADALADRRRSDVGTQLRDGGGVVGAGGGGLVVGGGGAGEPIRSVSRGAGDGGAPTCTVSRGASGGGVGCGDGGVGC
ncbi:MAG: hypothetical protein JWM27_1480, partial [Gemmatimonadetes bacterium]|nr:hypothetical protein [Gemmatimonadota bacterium]